jgi:hypothetical protein
MNRMIPIAAVLLATALLAGSCQGNGEPAPEAPPAEPGPPDGNATVPLFPGPANLVNQPERARLYRDLDNFTQRYMIARSEGSRGTWETLDDTVLRPMVDKNLDELLRTAASPEEPQFRVIASRGLGFGSDADRIVPVLMELLGLSDANLLSSALASLYLLASPDTPLGPLVALLNHEDADVRSNDALALSAAIRARRKEGRVPGTEDVREASGRLVYIVSNLQEDAFVRGHAAAALGAIGDPAATDILIGLLEDEHSVVRTRAAEGLGQLAQEPAILPLIDALADAGSSNEGFVIAAAIEKIAQVRGMPCDASVLGTDAERWRDWYAAVRR